MHKSRSLPLLGLMLWACCALSTSPCQAQLFVNVRLDTAPLVGHGAAPFWLDLQLTNGDGTPNNTTTLTNFDLGGGSASGSPTLVGGATGSLASAVTLTDSAFLNAFTQGLVPGSVLSFDLLLTTNAAEGGSPDRFSLALLDRTGSELPTLGVGNVFLAVDITSTGPLVQTSGSDPTRPPVGGGAPIQISAPQVEVIPEPETGALLVGCLLPLAGTLLRRRA